MIDHIVLLKLIPGHDGDELATVMCGLSDLTHGISGFLSFNHGENRDFEGRSPGWNYGFVAQFRDRTSLRLYAENDAHIALGKRLVALCEGGTDGLFVADLEGRA